MSDHQSTPPLSPDGPAPEADPTPSGWTRTRQRLWALRVVIATGLAAFVIGGLGGVALARGGASNDNGSGGHGSFGRMGPGGPGGFQRGGPGQVNGQMNGQMNGQPGVRPNGSSGRTP